MKISKPIKSLITILSIVTGTSYGDIVLDPRNYYSEVNKNVAVDEYHGDKQLIQFLVTKKINTTFNSNNQLFFHRGKMFDSFNYLRPTDDGAAGVFENAAGLRYYSEEEYMNDTYCYITAKPSFTGRDFETFEFSNENLTLEALESNPGYFVPAGRRAFNNLNTNVDEKSLPSDHPLASNGEVNVHFVEFQINQRGLKSITCSKFYLKDAAANTANQITIADMIKAFTGNKPVGCLVSPRVMQEDQCSANGPAEYTKDGWTSDLSSQPPEDSGLIPLFVDRHQ